MPQIDLAEVCKTVQQDLIKVAGSNAPLLQPERTGLLDALTSPVNKAGTEQLLTDTKDGMHRQVKLEYVKPSTYEDATDDVQPLCANGPTKSPNHALITVTESSSIKRDFDEDEMRDFWKKPSEHRALVMATDFNALCRRINRKLVALYAANVGGFVDGVGAGKAINLIQKKADGQIYGDPTGEVEMWEDLQNAGLTGLPFVVGSNIVSRYASLKKIGAANDLGQRIEDLAQWMFYRDRDPDLVNAPAANRSNMFVFAPGAAQLITYNKYKGEFKHKGDDFSKQTLVNPTKNLEVDWNFMYDKCTERYHSVMSLNFDYWVMPTDAYQANDERFGVNKTFLYNAAENIQV